jgi:hypothetical protein
MPLPSRVTIGWTLLCLATCLVGCGDRIQNEAIDKLGPEVPGVPKGPLHRGGQPCLVCHGGNGPGASTFSLAGTVYTTQGSHDPMADVLVTFLDSESREYRTGTNCAGNFFVMESDFVPVWPLFVKVTYGKQPNGAPYDHPMGSPVYREGSCNHCHADPAGPEAVGHIFTFDPGIAVPSGSCQQ